MFELHTGDCLEVMASLPAESFDSIVTDPPYGLHYLGNSWDRNVPGPEIWSQALRLLKPGGHLLAFGASRTYHRLGCAIEDAGFEIRDQIQWIYSTTKPKVAKGLKLKPSHEPICVARKPGRGLLNIDQCRGDDGRWPTNVIHDGSEQSVAAFPRAFNGKGSAANFFYLPKARPADRNEGLGELLNDHPTVKPTGLMAHLIRLVTPEGGHVLDPFMGSGSTGKAALRFGYQFTGIELEPRYVEIAAARLRAEQGERT